jgi:hypothetical protein
LTVFLQAEAQIRYGKFGERCALFRGACSFLLAFARDFFGGDFNMSARGWSLRGK